MNKQEFVVSNDRFYLKFEDRHYIIPAQLFHKYWKNPDFENTLEDYKLGADRSEKLVSLFNKYCSKDDEILELGCNIGRNLHYLNMAGYKYLSGIDVNQKAIDLGKTIFPDTVAKLPITCSLLEDAFLDMSPNSFDAIFSMAVLMHLHPSSEWVLQSMIQATRKYIITAEGEGMVSIRVIPRNYKDIFEKFGMKQVEEEYVEYSNTTDNTGKIKLMYRVFKK